MQFIYISSGGSSGYNPATSASHWWDASDTSTITDSAGNVTLFEDKIGSSDFVVGSGTPRTGVSTINGLNAINFDGNEYLKSASFSNVQTFLIGFVASIGTIDHPNDSIVSMNGAANDWQLEAHVSSFFDGYVLGDGTVPSIDLSSSPSSPWSGVNIFILKFDLGSSDLTVNVNGSDVASGTYTGIDATVDLLIGSNRGETPRTPLGDFGEMVIDPTISNDTNLYSYLSAKWIP